MALHVNTTTEPGGSWLETLKNVAHLLVEARRLAWVVAIAIFLGIALWNNSSKSAEQNDGVLDSSTCPYGIVLTLVGENPAPGEKEGFSCATEEDELLLDGGEVIDLGSTEDWITIEELCASNPNDPFCQ